MTGVTPPGTASLVAARRVRRRGYGCAVDVWDLQHLKGRWNDVLDDLEATNRTAWIALFDGRLASLTDTTLVLDFSDATKLAGVHTFERARRPQFAIALTDSIERVVGRRVAVTVTADS